MVVHVRLICNKGERLMIRYTVYVPGKSASVYDYSFRDHTSSGRTVCAVSPDILVALDGVRCGI